MVRIVLGDLHPMMVFRRPIHAGFVLLAFSVCGSVGCARRSARVQPPAAPARVGSIETGVASWYGVPYHGRRAASGEVYDMQQLTAAHRTLPFQTWVEVTNLSNGKQVEVRINDRGPFAKGRILDLSQAAARDIDMLRAGTARVRLKVAELFLADDRPALGLRGRPPRALNRLAQERVEASSCDRSEHIHNENEESERRGDSRREKGYADDLQVLQRKDQRCRNDHHHNGKINPTHGRSFPSSQADSTAAAAGFERTCRSLRPRVRCVGRGRGRSNSLRRTQGRPRGRFQASTATRRASEPG